MGVEGHESAKTAKQQLAQLLRSWWEQDPGKITQEALARRITQRGVRTSQEMLSRYLNRTRPTLVRPDLIRAMHEALGRAPEELAQALALHGKARASTSPGRVLALPPPQGWEGSPCVTAPDGSLHTASEGALSERAPDSSLPVTAPVSGQDTSPAGSRSRRPWILFASAVAVGAAVLTAAATLKGGDGREEGETPAR
ncbi:hypothetical protein DIZ27_42315 [Streptomyces sp. NWU339]|uniref:helix-turn-helix domain-containing protein n=1 Tax=Streptomyces sp. NWU339 TaxID=2185284 RepID=UPI000D67632E|nr:helix-turn-helix transcriptional regulator [Streptomyces sp. NWU339]PWI04924.1 hypothetical protein DIZ27_42315 [Streptomyces sp. NWU339]